MEPSFLSGWPGSKSPAQPSTKGNVAVSWEWRKLGLNPKGSSSNDKILQEAAEDHLVNKLHLTERSCELPGVPKSTFLMVFSPDGTKVASTHGNHKIYVSELSSGKHVKTLSGHPRTPWCIAFHPSRTQLLGSGCLGGQVRVWDLNGGSETWTVGTKAVIASIAFHPRERLLVIATYNELYFWDWSQPQPFTKVQTVNIKEKVRYVAFDTLGHKLITGISVCSVHGAPGAIQQPAGSANESMGSYSTGFLLNQSLDRNVPTYYSQLVNRYNDLLRNYNRRLFVTQQMNMTDRGTDPMEIETNQANQQPRNNASSENGNNSSENASSNAPTSASSTRNDSENQNNTENENNDGANSLNLDVQSISLGNTSAAQQPNTRRDTATPNSSTSAANTSPRLSPAAFARDLLRSNLRLSAFRPLLRYNSSPRYPNLSSQRPSETNPSTTQSTPTPTQQNDSSENNPPVDRDNIRNELTASLNRLQGYMENSIDETLNIIESNDLVRVFPVPSYLTRMSPREQPAGTTPPTSSRFPHVNGEEAPNTRHTNRQESANINSSNSSTAETSRNTNLTFEQHLYNIVRDSSLTFMNLVSESTEFNTIRQIIQHFRRQRNRRNALRERVRSPARTALMSSDDGSDSDREMFSPLPVHVYGSRYWSNPPTRNLGNYTINAISIDPTNTTTISRHIDHEYVRNNPQVTRLSDIPAPTRPESPTFPTNMVSSSRTSNNTNSMPSTSRDTPSRQGTSTTAATTTSEPSNSQGPEDRAFDRVTRGVQAIKKHTSALIGICSTRSTLPLRQLRRMWDDLRREIITIQCQSPNQGIPSYFSLSSRARCNLLSMSGSQRSNTNIPQPATDAPTGQDVSSAQQSEVPSTSNSEPSTSGNSNSPSTSSSADSRRDANAKLHSRRTYPPSSRLQTRLRYTHRDPATKIRLRSYLFNRLNRYHFNSLPIRRSYRARPYNREQELTRVYIRCHARRVLTVMFGIMMDCLEADQLGEQLISMLKSLKKALGLTCLLLISQSLNRDTPNTNSQNAGQSSQQSGRSAQQAQSSNPPSTESKSRIAVQISAVNRNNSSNACKRRETYYLYKRSQALRNRNSSLRMQPYKREADVVTSNPKSPAPTTTQQSNMADPAQPSTSGLRNVGRSEPSVSSESSTQPSTSRTTDPTALPFNPRIYSGLFRRFLTNNLNLFGDSIRIDNRRNTTEPVYEQYPRQIVYQHPPPNRRVMSMAARPSDFLQEDSSGVIDSIINNVVVPLVRVNDVPVSEMQNSESAPRQPGHVRLGEPPSTLPNPVDDNGGVNIFGVGPNLIIETPESPVHRIQAWDFTQGKLPEIGNSSVNVVVEKCKIHNDASIDISRDGLLLVALLPSQRMRNFTHRLGIYSLDWNCLGDCLYTALLEQNVVSISLSPCARHLALGLGSRRVSLQPYGRNGVMALIYRLGGPIKNENNSGRRCLIPIRSLEQSWDLGFTSLNCLRWAPQPGQGLVYANNTGQLKILS